MRVRHPFVFLLVACPAFATWQNQVANPDFDSGTDSWLPELGASSGGTLSWDPLAGDPAAGSAKVDNVFVEPAVDGFRQCVAISDSLYSLEVNVASALQAGNSCRVRVDFIAEASCFVGAPVALEVKLTNTRNDGMFETLASGGTLPDGVVAAAVFLEHIRVADAAAGDSVCRFDHVELGSDTVFAAAFD